MQILWTIIIGLVVGAIARFLMPGRDSMGLILTTLLGVAGALITQFLGQAMGLYTANEPAGFVGAILGAILLLSIARAVTRRGVTSP